MIGGGFVEFVLDKVKLQKMVRPQIIINDVYGIENHICIEWDAKLPNKTMYKDNTLFVHKKQISEIPESLEATYQKMSL